jgi:hypothetical protein
VSVDKALVRPKDVPLNLDQHEESSFYAIWQKPEARFTHFGIGAPEWGSSWILVCGSKDAAKAYIALDAEHNQRPTSAYEAKCLSLSEAFDEVRNQELPIVHSTGERYGAVGGVAVFEIDAAEGFCIAELLAL